MQILGSSHWEKDYEGLATSRKCRNRSIEQLVNDETVVFLGCHPCIPVA